VLYPISGKAATFNCTPIWFLYCLFAVEIIYFIVSKYCRKWRPLLVPLLFVVGLVTGIHTNLHFPFKIDVAFVAVFFYWWGHQTRIRANLIAESSLTKSFFGRGRWVYIPFAFLGLAMAVSLNSEMRGMASNCLGSVPLLLIGVFFGSLLVVSLGSALRDSKIALFLGANTVFILGYNYWANDLTSLALSRLNLRFWPLVLLVQLVSLAIGALCFNYIFKAIKVILKQRSALLRG
jgi:hypothetical protein